MPRRNIFAPSQIINGVDASSAKMLTATSTHGISPSGRRNIIEVGAVSGNQESATDHHRVGIVEVYAQLTSMGTAANERDNARDLLALLKIAPQRSDRSHQHGVDGIAQNVVDQGQREDLPDACKEGEDNPRQQERDRRPGPTPTPARQIPASAPIRPARLPCPPAVVAVLQRTERSR